MSVSADRPAKAYAPRPWRKSILLQLNERKAKEQKPFEDITNYCCKLFEGIDSLRSENVQLNVQREKLQQENTRFALAPSGQPSTPGAAGDDRNAMLEKKLFQLQEELTEMHRRKGENVQQVIEFKNALEAKELELQRLKSKLSDSELALHEYKLACKCLEQRILDIETQNQAMKDEHQALQIAYTSLEKKNLEREKEHNLLVERWIALKARDADLLNAENEKLTKIQQEKKMKEIEAAIQEIQVDDIKESYSGQAEQGDPMCIVSVLPERSLLHFDAHEGEVNALRWLPSSEGLGVVATGGADRKVKIWNITQTAAHLKTTLAGSNAAITCIDLESDLVLASSNDFASRVWTIDGKLRRTLTGHSNKVLAVRFLGVPNKVVSGSHDRTLKIWDLNRHACIRTLFAGSSCNDLVTREVQDSAIISGHFDKRIRFWDTRSDASANEILLEGRITSLAISPNGQFLLSCVRDDTLKQLDLRMNQVVRTFCAEGFKVGCDWSRAVFSPDNDYVAAGSQEGGVFIWSLNTGKVEKILKADQHSSTVITCGWNPTGKLFMSCDRNKKAVVWSD